MSATASRSAAAVRLSWLLCCALAGLTFVLYASLSLNAGDGQPVMPVDDAYIHFQYARQIAAGQFYVYNPGLPPTSGATSFLYPYLLAVGYLLGFQGLNLGLWALGWGALALLSAGWAVYRLTLRAASGWLATAAMALFMLTGSVGWHFMSGMETGLAISFTLWTLYTFMTRQRAAFVTFATLLTLTRPEGGILALLATVAWLLRDLPRLTPRAALNTVARNRALLLPALAFGVQPLVNLLLTGSLSASGGQAKSLFGMIPADTAAVWGRIAEHYARMWGELLTGGSRDGLWYLPLLVGVLALAGWGDMLRRRDMRPTALLIAAWLAVTLAAIATLDTAFWHFKRYQMPLLALLFPLAGWGIDLLWRLTQRQRYANISLFDLRGLRAGLVTMLLLFTVWTAWNFLGYYALNTRAVAAQPLAMARWIDSHLPPDAVIAVHDVGTTRYIGGRTTLDMVGLTTPGAAESWRHGPGAVGEWLIAQRPDYVAAYTTARGLDYLAASPVYGELLAGFETPYNWRYNVALGGMFQGVFQPDWVAAERAANPAQHSSLRYINGLLRVDAVNVADLPSERAHGYTWSERERLPGFATEFYGLYSIYPTACGDDDCLVMDGGRRINGEERFTLNTIPDQDLILITRVHPVNGGTLTVLVNGEPVATRLLFAQPGQWLELATLIPAARLTRNQTEITIIPDTPGGHYMPYHHWAYQGAYRPDLPAVPPTVTYQDGALQVFIDGFEVALEQRQVTVRLRWAAEQGATGDYKAFAHLYSNLNDPPTAQADSRPGSGALPPANWLPGQFDDTLTLDISTIAPGTYSLAFGLYDPLTGERLLPTLLDDATILPDEVGRRLLIGAVTIPDRGAGDD